MENPFADPFAQSFDRAFTEAVGFSVWMVAGDWRSADAAASGLDPEDDWIEVYECYVADYVDTDVDDYIVSMLNDAQEVAA